MVSEQLIKDALCMPNNAIEYTLGQCLAELYTDKAILEGQNGLFDVEEYALAQLCTIEHKAMVHNQVITHWQGHAQACMALPPAARQLLRSDTSPAEGSLSAEQEFVERSKNAWLTVTWGERTLEVLLIHWTEGMRQFYHYWIIAENQSCAQDFLVAVCQWNAQVRGEVLVFLGGCWRKDAQLFQDIQASTFDSSKKQSVS